jgi:dinuclear metal center YbgI/SA1388 family protein
LAPLEWAEPWDNVGLIIEPKERPIANVFLTIDLTEESLLEARNKHADLIVAYHPPIFSGLKRITQKAPLERIVIDAIRNDIAVYSPHTALDAAPNGMNVWLAQALGEGTLAPIVPLPNAPPGVGMGRFVELAQPRALNDLLSLIKQHLGLSQLRIAAAPEHKRGIPIRRAAVCAGAGGSIFEKCGHVDLLLTGEMRHHDILARVAAGTTVILTDHTNTERGYLPHLAEYLRRALGSDVEIVISQTDQDPLVIG